jgi:hypothetical protein
VENLVPSISFYVEQDQRMRLLKTISSGVSTRLEM